jgi:hypothetical protein
LGNSTEIGKVEGYKVDAGSDCSFDVRGVTVQELPEEDTFVVALTDEPDGDGRLLMFQLGTAAFDEQDVGLGQDTYCLCDEIGTTVYGGVTSCVLAGDLLTIQLDEEAATALGTAKECQLRLLVDARSVESVAQGLKKIFTSAHPTPARLEL